MWKYNYEYVCHGLRGFKYIKREKGKNGKWIYTYPYNASEADGRRDMNNVKQPQNANPNSTTQSSMPKSSKMESNKESTKEKITNNIRSRIKKELFNTYLKSKDTTLPERERIQNEQAIGQILNRVERQYGETVLEEMNSFCESFEKFSKIDENDRDLYIAITNEDAAGKEDPYDKTLPMRDIVSCLKEKYPGQWDSFLNNVKKQVRITCFNFDFDNMKDFSDDEIVMLYYASIIRDKGYNNNDITVSYYLQQDGFIDQKKVLSDSGVTKISDLKRIEFDGTTAAAKMIDDDKDMELVNHSNLDAMALTPYTTYPQEAGDGYTTNCTYCTIAYDLRQRGFDVEASAVCWDTDNTTESMAEFYEDIVTHESATVRKCTDTSYKRIKKELLSDTKNVMGVDTNNARGYFAVSWKTGSGHAMAYEITNGEITIRDCQTNEAYGLEEWHRLYSNYITNFRYFRTDNKKVRDTALVAVKNRQDD